MRALPAGIAFLHFGDSDPAGFDILRDLRERSGLTITSLHMHNRPALAPVPLSDDDPKTIRRLLASPYLTNDEKGILETIARLEDKGSFEQESLGVPIMNWPFYTTECQNDARLFPVPPKSL